MMLASRFSIVFLNEYWVIIHSFVLLVISLILITIWIWEYWFVPDTQAKQINMYENFIEKVNN
jgi:hypothetical protein